MKGYKAFKKGMICQGKQYAENTVFEEDEAVICESRRRKNKRRYVLHFKKWRIC